MFVLESSQGEQKWEHWHALLGLERQNRMLWTEWVNRNINKLQFNYELKANNITEINKEQQIADNCVINGFKAGALLKPEHTQKRGTRVPPPSSGRSFGALNTMLSLQNE